MIDLNIIVLIGFFLCLFKLVSKGTIINIGGTVNYYNKEEEILPKKAKEKLYNATEKLLQ